MWLKASEYKSDYHYIDCLQLQNIYLPIYIWGEVNISHFQFLNVNNYEIDILWCWPNAKTDQDLWI